MRILIIAVVKPLRRTFEYLPPNALTDTECDGLQPGVRIKVPFANGVSVGVLIGITHQSNFAPEKLKRAIEILDPAPLLDSITLHLAQWAAAYYAHPIGEVLSLCFPPNLRSGGALKREQNALRLTETLNAIDLTALAKSPRQHALIERLRQGTTAIQQLKKEGFSTTLIKTIVDRGFAVRCESILPAETQQFSAPGHTLNEEQATASTGLQGMNGFSAALLYGVTGSGKTEVYMSVIDKVISEDRSVLVLIPEIALTPQTESRFRNRFGAAVGVLHSGLNPSQREREWHKAQSGQTRVLLGTRSAIFTPLPNLGYLIVDEEHDSAYKQQDGFRYHARDLAIKRAQLSDCPVLLGSATPSLETLNNVRSGRFGLFELSRRTGSASLPDWSTVDLRKKTLSAGLSEDLISQIQATLARNEHALLFLNRRGFAHTLLCHDCGWIAECTHCDSRLVIHRRQKQLRCHHCLARQPLPTTCPHCRGAHWHGIGTGTERAEHQLEQLFPQTRVIRIDSDAISSATQLEQELTDIATSQEGLIIVGTQMLAKGHDLERVTLVGIVDTDALLFSSDFRAEEKLAQLLTQVAGRAGRRAGRGQVVLQTHQPQTPLFEQLRTKGYWDTAQQLLNTRIDQGLPPLGQMILIHCDGADAQAAERLLSRIKIQLQKSLSNKAHLIGPLPAPLARRAGKFRFQLTILAPHAKTLTQETTQIIQVLEQTPNNATTRLSVDIDPHDFI